MTATLVIIYNNKFDQNIPLLERMYKDKFTNVYHLVPFYTGDQKNVIPIYETSHYFSNYVAQSFKAIFSPEVDHYIYLSDDLLLNPKINQDNYQQFFNLDSETNYISSLTPLHQQTSSESELWFRREGFRDNNHKIVTWHPEPNILRELPSIKEALSSFNKFGLSIQPLHATAVHWNPTVTSSKYVPATYNLSYPVVCSYSDFFIISKESIREFAHYCGLFAVSRLWVEAAIPTALVLSANKITTRMDSDFSQKGALWTSQQKKFLEPFNNNLAALISQFPDDYPYIHPIKLSTWT